MRILLAGLILIVVAGCSASRPMAKLHHSGWLLEDWNPEKATAEAEMDLRAGTPKVYESGTLFGELPGISPEQRRFVKRLPHADAGLGCDVSHPELRKAQREYARRYNEYIVQQLSKGAGRTKGSSQ